MNDQHDYQQLFDSAYSRAREEVQDELRYADYRTGILDVDDLDDRIFPRLLSSALTDYEDVEAADLSDVIHEAISEAYDNERDV